MACMSGALEEVVEDTAARAEIRETLAKLADWMRNQADNPHDRGGPRP
jgi:hemoglobin